MTVQSAEKESEFMLWLHEHIAALHVIPDPVQVEMIAPLGQSIMDDYYDSDLGALWGQFSTATA